MHVREAYTIAIGSLFVVFLGWQLAAVGDVLRRRGVRLFRKVFLETLLLTRRRGSSNYTVGAIFVLASLCTGNIIALCVQVKNVGDIAERLRGLLHVNLVPLFLSVRTPLLSELFFGLTFQSHSLLHRQLGWICVAEGLGYTVLSLFVRQWSIPSMKFGITLAMTLMFVTSILYLRRIFFELFLKIHMLLGVALVTCLWLEADLSWRDFHTICLTIMTSLWSLEKSIWLGQSALNRYRGSDEISISHSLTETLDSDAALVQINLKRPRKVKYGQYVFVTVPSLPHSIIGRLQSHPYMVAWSDIDSKGLSRTVTLLIAHRNGFSRTISRLQPSTLCSLDGPYGTMRRLEDFDKVLFVASGVGIAAHLLAIRHLLNAHKDQTSRVRRLSLLWFIETEDQEHWARPFLTRLLKQDEGDRRIMTVFIYKPYNTIPTTSSAHAEPDSEFRRLYRVDISLDMDWLIGQEWAAEAGNMALSLCGSPLFENRVRRALWHSPHDIELITSPFQMDENTLSRAASHRFHNSQKRIRGKIL